MTTKTQILAAARAAFDKRGLDGLSLRDVARDVGITPMAIYRHYSDKDALIDALVLDGLDEWSARVAAVPSGAPLDWIARIGDAYLDFALAEPRRFEAAFLIHSRAARRYPDDFVAGRSPAGTIQLKNIKAAIAAGTLARSPPVEIFITIAALSQGLVTLYRAGRVAGGEAAFRKIYRRAMRRCLDFLPQGETTMIAIACALLSAIGFYFSLGLGDQWWLAWLAPIPVLWFAFGKTNWWQAFLAAFAACALGATSILRAYAGLLPTPLLVLGIAGPALLFALSAMSARRVDRALGPVAAMFAFAALWAAFDFLVTFDRAGGSVSTPAASQVGAPMLIQSASLVGFMGITFLLGLVPAGIALSLRSRTPLPAAIAVAVFAANAALGAWHMSAPPASTIHVALIDSDDAMGKTRQDDKPGTFKAIDAYAAEIAKLDGAHVKLIVLPENISRVAPEWRGEAQAKLAAAADAAHATLVAGFNTQLDGAQRNVSWAFVPGAATPVTYEKRRLVPVLEFAVFTPGPGPKALADGTGLEICKDMDFQAMIRADEVATAPALLAVPAWDFDKDDWSHARVAILRSVENGVPMARSARDGLLTLNDRYGRVVAEARTVGGFTTLIGDLPLDGRGGQTLYDRIGDVFGWVCVLMGAGLVGLAFWRGRRARN